MQEDQTEAVLTYKWHLAGIQERSLPLFGVNAEPYESQVQRRVVAHRHLVDPRVHVPHLPLTEVGCEEFLCDRILLRLHVRQHQGLQRLHLAGELACVVAAGSAPEQLRREEDRRKEMMGEEKDFRDGNFPR